MISHPTQSTGLTRSSEETIASGRAIGKSLERGDILCLEGTLGVGKTTLAKGIIAQLSEIDPDSIPSPTFNYLNLYESPLGIIAHFDLYRLTAPEQFLTAGFDEYFGSAICIIEWSERIAPILPKSAKYIYLEHVAEGRRIDASQVC